MSVIVTELYESRKFTRTSNGKQVTRVYLVDGTNDCLTAADSVPDYGDEYIDDGGAGQQIYVVSVGIVRQESVDQCRATVVYESRQKGGGATGQVGQEVWDWSFMSAQEKITNIKEEEDRTTYNIDNLGGKHPGYGTAINKSGDKVEGATVYVKRSSLRVTKYYQPSAVDETWLEMIDELSVTVNETSWQGYDAGEVLFLGATVREVNDEMTQIDYQFLMNKNIENQSEVIMFTTPGAGAVTFVPATVSKEGWQHRGYIHRDMTDRNTKIKYHGITEINVDTVYDKDDFEKLDLTRPSAS